ncbi:hypothetical protein MOF05_07635 [Bacillus haynesii]|uniref:hypothetical protein n=1 Tax=Bacillus TaxID=1386 RepID=UPI002283113D|nr:MULTISPECIES: hypothetical protein [Bacillus]MCY7773468.1 hypothetical protein [Bacillus licheniformis]MCY7780180.1 hypothetical protein [Bacillus haynesii]MCY8021509.1 hypothetical protein [Bacillus licheniformis]MCY8530051.1 hypothetical protein [Bacillus licheniformis]MCY9266901.1 hypothetical protein [Bacillus licheniformis]
MKSKMKIIFLGIVVASMIPTTSAFASEVQSFWWKTLDDYFATISTEGHMTGEYKSNGGDYRVCVYNIRSGNTMTVSLYEIDPGLPFERIGSRKGIKAQMAVQHGMD